MSDTIAMSNNGGPTSFDVEQAYKRGLADGQANLERERALARLKQTKKLRTIGTHYHNTFEPDNCNCMFCCEVAELERAAKQDEEGK